MSIQIEINGELREVTKEELFSLAKNGQIRPSTPLHYKGTKIFAGKVKDIVFSSSPEPVENTASPEKRREPKPDDCNDYRSGYPDVFEAAAKGTVDDVRFFIEKTGIDVNAKNEFGQTPLYCVAFNGSDINVLKYLVSKGADVNTRDQSGYTPLHSSGRHADILKYLVSQGANVNAKNERGETPIQSAISWDSDVEGIECLISHGADIDVRNDNGDTLLHIAAENSSNVEMFRCLISHGLNVNSKNNENYTPLHHAAFWATNVNVVQYLVSQGADVNAKNDDGRIPSHLASEGRNSKEKIRILHREMRRNETSTSSYKSPYDNIHCAAEQGTVDDMRYLVEEMGIDVDEKFPMTGTTPLIFASGNNPDVEVIRYLVSQGANVNAKDNFGLTALYNAAAGNPNVEVLKFLLSQGADVNAKHNDGKTTALDVASTDEMKRILLEAKEKQY